MSLQLVRMSLVTVGVLGLATAAYDYLEVFTLFYLTISLLRGQERANVE